MDEFKKDSFTWKYIRPNISSIFWNSLFTSLTWKQEKKKKTAIETRFFILNSYWFRKNPVNLFSELKFSLILLWSLNFMKHCFKTSHHKDRNDLFLQNRKCIKNDFDMCCILDWELQCSFSKQPLKCLFWDFHQVWVGEMRVSTGGSRNVPKLLPCLCI